MYRPKAENPAPNPKPNKTMKKIISFFLLAAVLLAWTAPNASAQHRASLTPDQANDLLKKSIGSWEIKSVIWQPWLNKFAFSGGSASFRYDDDGCVHERLAIEQPDGRYEETEGLLRYSETNKRFELVQIDKVGNTNLIMYGKWDPDFNMIAFSPAKGQKHISDKVIWQYFFFDDGSFKKVIRTPDGQGNSIIAAEFHCLQPNMAKRRN